MEPLKDTVCVESIKQIMRIFGGKWAFLVMGELHTGPKHFNELCRKLQVNTKSLTDTLRTLQENGIIEREVKTLSPISVTYSLTKKGKDFEKVFSAMRDWGEFWMTEGQIE